MQEKYEDIIHQKEIEIKDIQQQKKMIQDTLQNEIEFFKNEISRLTKIDEIKRMTSDNDQFTRDPEKEMSFNKIMGGLDSPQPKQA